jgi:DDE superfamily endonuclease
VKMPRKSKRAVFLSWFRKQVRVRLLNKIVRLYADEEDSLEDVKDVASLAMLQSAEGRRYLHRNSTYRKSLANERFTTDLDSSSAPVPSTNHDGNNDANISDASDHELPWLNDDEFLQKFRVTREAFAIILDKIKDHPVFESKTKAMAPPEYQLMVFLKYIGTEGAGSSNANQRQTFGVGYGTSSLYRKRVTKALLSLREEYITWPDSNERKVISKDIQRQFDFPHCVGIADGTLFPLAFEPSTEDAPDYSGRKYGYSLTTMVICDHKRRIRHYLAGFPGSAHDNRVFKSTKVATEAPDYFDPMQYIIGDSAFENDWFMVSAFKKPKNQSIPRSHEQFNEKLARLRIISEHCIGILKGRFPWLRSIRLKITEDSKSLKEILELIDATIILHNILIEIGEKEKEEWIDHDDFSDIDNEDRVPKLTPMDVLNLGIPANAPKDERRKRIMFYFEEHYYF